MICQYDEIVVCVSEPRQHIDYQFIRIRASLRMCMCVAFEKEIRVYLVLKDEIWRAANIEANIGAARARCRAQEQEKQ